jgi:putative zinc finger protein
MERKILSGALERGPECLDVEVIARYVDDALAPRERDAAKAHIDACPTCQAEITLIQAFADARVSDEESIAVREIVADLQRRPSAIVLPAREESRARRGLSFGMWRATLSAAAALLVAIVAGYYLLGSNAPRLPNDIDSGREVTRSLTVILRGPIGDQTTAPTRLEWQSVASAVRYRVRLMEVDRSELWSAETTKMSIDLPTAIRARIVPAKTLLWDVTAYGVTSEIVAASDVERFRLVP